MFENTIKHVMAIPAEQVRCIDPGTHKLIQFLELRNHKCAVCRCADCKAAGQNNAYQSRYRPEVQA